MTIGTTNETSPVSIKSQDQGADIEVKIKPRPQENPALAVEFEDGDASDTDFDAVVSNAPEIQEPTTSIQVEEEQGAVEPAGEVTQRLQDIEVDPVPTSQPSEPVLEVKEPVFADEPSEDPEPVAEVVLLNELNEYLADNRPKGVTDETLCGGEPLAYSKIAEMDPFSGNRFLATLVLGFATLNISTRKVLFSGSKDFSFEMFDGVDCLDTAYLVLRTPKDAGMSLSELIEGLKSVATLASNPFVHGGRYSLFSNPVSFYISKEPLKIKKLKPIDIANLASRGDLINIEYLDSESVSIDGADIVAVYSHTIPSSASADIVDSWEFNLPIIGEVQSTAFAFDPSSLDVVSLAVDSMAKYIRLLISQGYTVNLSSDFNAPFSVVSQPIEATDEDNNVVSELQQFQEMFSVSIHTFSKLEEERLAKFINPHFLGDKLASKANVVGEDTTSRIASCRATLELIERTNPVVSLMRHNVWELRTLFNHTLELDFALSEIDEDEESED